jgi:hypothetical protein
MVSGKPGCPEYLLDKEGSPTLWDKETSLASSTIISTCSSTEPVPLLPYLAERGFANHVKLRNLECRLSMGAQDNKGFVSERGTQSHCCAMGGMSTTCRSLKS